ERWNSGRTKEGLADAREALRQTRLACARSPGSPGYRRRLAGSCRLLAEFYRLAGRPADSVAVTWERLHSGPQGPGDLYAPAGDCARNARAVGRGKKDLSEAEKEQRRRYAGHAVAALRRAEEHGFRDAARLAKEKALDVLRDRDDFKDLLGRLTKGK